MNPTIDFDLNLGVLGTQCASIGYRSDDKDVQYIIIDNAPLYLELELTTLDCFTQAMIAEEISIDSMERNYAAAEHRRDLEREDGGRV